MLDTVKKKHPVSRKTAVENQDKGTASATSKPLRQKRATKSA